MSGPGSSRCVAWVPELPVRGQGVGACGCGFGFCRGLEDEGGGKGGVGG